MRALVANDPLVYREVVVNALRKLRPLIDVSAAGSEDLEREVEHLRPHLVICSRPSEAVKEHAALAWVVLYPDGEDRADIGDAGGRTAFLSGVRVADLLSVVDETELLLGNRRASGNGRPNATLSTKGSREDDLGAEEGGRVAGTERR